MRIRHTIKSYLYLLTIIINWLTISAVNKVPFTLLSLMQNSIFFCTEFLNASKYKNPHSILSNGSPPKQINIHTFEFFLLLLVYHKPYKSICGCFIHSCCSTSCPLIAIYVQAKLHAQVSSTVADNIHYY